MRKPRKFWRAKNHSHDSISQTKIQYIQTSSVFNKLKYITMNKFTMSESCHIPKKHLRAADGFSSKDDYVEVM